MEEEVGVRHYSLAAVTILDDILDLWRCWGRMLGPTFSGSEG